MAFQAVYGLTVRGMKSRGTNSYLLHWWRRRAMLKRNHTACPVELDVAWQKQRTTPLLPVRVFLHLCRNAP